MRGQASVIGMALFMIAMIFMTIMHMGLVYKTNQLLDAGRKRAELVAERARENLNITWRFDRTHPYIVVENTGSIPLKIILVRFEIRKKQGDSWPEIENYNDISENRWLAVGGKATYYQNLFTREQVERNYDNRILEVRILTERGNVFVSICKPIKTPESRFYNTILFYWSAIDWMDIENNKWWHGDHIGYYKMTKPDVAVQIDNSIEIPGWEATSGQWKWIEFKFIAYIPGTDGRGYIFGTNNKFLVLAIESVSGIAYMTVSVSIYDDNGNWKYSGWSNTYFIFTTQTMCFKLDPSNPVFILYNGDEKKTNSLGWVPKNLKPGWYIVEVSIGIEGVAEGTSIHFGLKSIAMYISDRRLW